MDRTTKITSPKPPQVPSAIPDQPIELWEPPFERWMRMADDLLRDWPHHPVNTHEHRIWSAHRGAPFVRFFGEVGAYWTQTALRCAYVRNAWTALLHNYYPPALVSLL